MNENRKNSVQQELKILDSKLWNLDKRNPFTTPKGYFAEIQDKVMKIISDKKRENKESDIPDEYFSRLQDTVLSKIAVDELDGIPKQVLEQKRINPFRVPDDYFKTIQATIIRQIIPSRGNVIRMRFNRIAMIAASVAAFITCVWVLSNLSKPKLSEDLVDISSSEVLQYVQNHIDEYDFYQIEEFLHKEELGDFESMDIDQDEIESYLEEQMDDLNIEELL